MKRQICRKSSPKKCGNKCNKNCTSAKRQTIVKSAIKWLVIAVTKSLIKHLIHRLFDWLF